MLTKTIVSITDSGGIATIHTVFPNTFKVSVSNKQTKNILVGLKGNLDIYLNEFEDYLKKATEAQPCNATGRSKPMFPKGSQQCVINDFAIRAMGNVWLHP